MLEPLKKPNPPKKPEPRTAGAPTNREDVFNNPLSIHPEDANPGNGDPEEEKITLIEALKEKAEEARCKSVQMLEFGEKKDDSKDDSEDGGPKTT